MSVIAEMVTGSVAGAVQSPDAYGVSYSPRYGSRCPRCGELPVKAYHREPWKDDIRERYHRCPECGLRFKSIQVDPVWREVCGE